MTDIAQPDLTPEGAPTECHFEFWNHPFRQRKMWGIPPLYPVQIDIIEEAIKWRSMVCGTFPNEAGKTSTIIPLLGLSTMAAFPGAIVYSTAGSENQITDQLFKHLEAKVLPYKENGWKINKSELTVTAPSFMGLRPSQWISRVPRDALTGEGYHNNVQVDNKGRWHFQPLFMILDEGKSLGQEVFEMALRLNPAFMLAVSTPGKARGPFFRAVDPDDMKRRLKA